MARLLFARFITFAGVVLHWEQHTALLSTAPPCLYIPPIIYTYCWVYLPPYSASFSPSFYHAPLLCLPACCLLAAPSFPRTGLFCHRTPFCYIPAWLICCTPFNTHHLYHGLHTWVSRTTCFLPVFSLPVHYHYHCWITIPTGSFFLCSCGSLPSRRTKRTRPTFCSIHRTTTVFTHHFCDIATHFYILTHTHFTFLLLHIFTHTHFCAHTLFGILHTFCIFTHTHILGHFLLSLSFGSALCI